MARAACLHCGLPVQASGPEPRQFCCYGCELSHALWQGGPEAGVGVEKSLLARLMLSIFFAMVSMMFTMALYASAFYTAEGHEHALGPLAPICRWLAIAFAAPVLLLLGWPLAHSGWLRWGTRNATAAVDSLVALGVTAAYILSFLNAFRERGEIYVETSTVTLVLVTLGRYLDAQARRRAAGSLRSLLTLDPGVAWVSGREGPESLSRIPVAEVQVGETVRVFAGERIPIDGRVVAGSGAVDESLITGEAEPRRRSGGSTLHAGGLLVDGCVDLLVENAAGDRLLDRMLELVESSEGRKMPLERLGDRITRVFLPVPLLVAVGTVVYWGSTESFEVGLLHALAVLLVACPCALGIATPLATWVAIGRAARAGILVRGGEVFERLSRPCRFFFDKTGTLTLAELEVVKLSPGPRADPSRAYAVAGALARRSKHPAAEAVRTYCEAQAAVGCEVEALEVIPGLGVRGRIPGEGMVVLGSRRLAAESLGGESPLPAPEGSVLVVEDGHLLGSFRLEERVRPEAAQVLAWMRAEQLEPTVLTGDTQGRGEALGRALSVEVEAELLPTAKLERLEAARGHGPTVVMVGDGLNDAPVLAAADVGIALSRGADLAREAADVILLEQERPLDRLPYLVGLSRRTTRNVRFNFVWSFAYNTVGIALAALGYVHPIVAALLMIVSSLSVVAGSLRGEESPPPPAGSQGPGGEKPRDATQSVAEGPARREGGLLVST